MFIYNRMISQKDLRMGMLKLHRYLATSSISLCSTWFLNLPEVWQGQLKFLQSLVSGDVICGNATLPLDSMYCEFYHLVSIITHTFFLNLPILNFLPRSRASVPTFDPLLYEMRMRLHLAVSQFRVYVHVCTCIYSKWYWHSTCICAIST